MFGPYRSPPEPVGEPPAARPEEELVLAWSLVVLGGIRVAIALLTHEVWGSEAGLALLALGGGLVTLSR